MSKLRPRLWLNRLLRNSMKGYVFLLAIAIILLVGLVAVSSLIDRDVWWNAYYTLGINPVDTSIHNHLWLYLLLGVCGAFVFGGLMVMVFTSGVERSVERVRDGQVRYHKMCGHVVIIGWTPITVGLIEQVCRKHPHAQVLLLSHEHPAGIHAELAASLAFRDERRTIVYASGESGISMQLESLCLNNAVELYVAIDDTPASPQPIAQLSLLEAIANTIDKRQSPLRVNVMIDDIDTYNTLQRIDLPTGYYSNSNGCRTLDIRLFNFYENWSRVLWGYGGGDRFAQLDFEPIENGDKHVHLVIVGFGNMGRALFYEALRVCHYPTDSHTRITVIDPQAAELQLKLRAQMPFIDAIEDIEVDFIADNIESDAIRQKLECWSDDDRTMLTIAICIPTPAEALRSALNLPETIFCNPRYMELAPYKGTSQRLVSNSTRTHVLVQQAVLNAPNAIVEDRRYPHLQLFGTLIPEGANVDLLDDKLAIAINGLYHDNMFGQVQDINIEEHMPRWTDLWFDTDITPESSKHASRYQSDLFRSTISILKRHNLADNASFDEKLAECEHRRWIAERTLMNWRNVHTGEHRVDILRRHDCIVPYDVLSEEEKQKDRDVIRLAQRLFSSGAV